MIFDLLGQLASELFRALLIDELSERVRARLMRWLFRRRARRRERFSWYLRSRPSRQLLHKLRTGTPEKVS
jgi:hypothetical protein